MARWIKTNFPGVRYREHEGRKHGVKKDQYFTIRYKLNKTGREEGLGWASEGWSASKAYGRLLELKENQKVGEGPQTLEEKRKIEEAKREQAALDQKQVERDAITFSEIFTKHYTPISLQNKTNATVEAENSLFKLWITPVIGRLPMKSISPLHLERIKKNMADAGRAPRYAQYGMAVIRQVFNFAKTHEIYEGPCPVGKVKIPKFDNKRLRFLSHNEADQLLEGLKAHSVDVYHMALLSLHCGPRAGEVFALQWADVNIEAGVVTLRDTKNGTTRHCKMTDAVKRMFMERGPGKRDELVFPSTRGTMISGVSNTYEIVVNELRLNEGVTDRRYKVVWHTLRHTHASWLAISGVSLHTIKKMLGHKTLSQTERYSHLHEDNINDAIRVLEESCKPVDENGSSVINFSK